MSTAAAPTPAPAIGGMEDRGGRPEREKSLKDAPASDVARDMPSRAVPAFALTPASVPFLPRGVRLQFDAVRQAWMLLAPERAIRLDQIGQAILSRVDGARSLGAIAQDLAETFNAPIDQILSDSAGYLAALMERRILELRPRSDPDHDRS